MTERTIKLTIAALGGQGGGVLTDWLIEVAETSGYIVQATSVPGVAQRTGATIYYLEFFARAAAERLGREPVMALMPVPGDVDCVVASELAEAGRAIARGLVTPELTTLISSTHRAYAIGEKSALGQGATDTRELLELVRTQGRRTILFDMEEMAERHHSVISAVLLGAISGAGVLPFRKQSFTEAIRKSGIAVKTNLAAFEEAYQQAQAGGTAAAVPPAAAQPQSIPRSARTPELQPLLERIHRLPGVAQALALEGVRRMLDYQDPQYAALYLTSASSALDERSVRPSPRQRAGRAALTAGDGARAGAVDVLRGSDPGRRAQDARGALRAGTRGDPRRDRAALWHHGVHEAARSGDRRDAAGRAGGAGCFNSPGVSRWLGRFTGGRHIRTSTSGRLPPALCSWEA